MGLTKLTRLYLLLSIISSIAVAISIKIIMENTEGAHGSFHFVDFLIFHGGYILIALVVLKLVKLFHSRWLSLATLVLFLPLSLLELAFVSAATNEALAFGYLPLILLRLSAFLVIIIVAIVLHKRGIHA